MKSSDKIGSLIGSEVKNILQNKETVTDLKFKFDHLIIRENILSFYEVRNLKFLQEKLVFL